MMKDNIARTLAWDEWLITHLMFGPTTMLTYALVGALVAARHPRSPIGWLLSAEGLFSALTMFASNFDALSLPSSILIITMIEDDAVFAACTPAPAGTWSRARSHRRCCAPSAPSPTARRSFARATPA
jgi:hypothetical protein